MGKNRRVTANWPGPMARALLADGAALTIKAMAKAETRDLIATF